MIIKMILQNVHGLFTTNRPYLNSLHSENLIITAVGRFMMSRGAGFGRFWYVGINIKMLERLLTPNIL